MTGAAPRLLDQLVRAPASEPAWLGELRDQAVAALRARGLPTARDEAWRFTSLRGVLEQNFQSAPDAELSHIVNGLAAEAAWDNDTSAWRMALINGVPRGAPGRSGEPESISGADVSVLDVASLMASSPAGPAEIGTGGGHPGEQALAGAVREHLGRLAPVEHFSALNLARFEHGLVIRVGRGVLVERPIHLLYCQVPGADATAAYPRVLVMAEPGSRLHLIESFVVAGGAPHLCCPVTEIAVAQAAHVSHSRIHYGGPNGYLLGCVAVRQERDSRYESRVVSLGGVLSRLDLRVALAEPGAECTLDGAYHVHSGEHVAHVTSIDHSAPGCTSSESYRGILDGNGRAVFDGTITVRPDAQATSARQENRNLLLSDDAVINTKPHLRIDADDVSCSHGATVGSLDEDQIFYLRARGLNEKRARAVLTYGFVREIIDEIGHPAVAMCAAAAMRARLPGRDDPGERDELDMGKPQDWMGPIMNEREAY